MATEPAVRHDIMCYLYPYGCENLAIKRTNHHGAMKMLTTSLKPSLDEILERRVSSDAPGVQVLLTSPTEILYQGAVGLADAIVVPTDDNKLTASHQANLYSVSKFFTACCVLKLIEQGKLSGADQVRDYLPVQLQKLVAKDCIIEQLVAHVGGAPNPLPLQWVHSPNETVDETELLATVLRRHPFQTSSNNRHLFQYSNVGYWLLGHVVTTVCNAQPSEFVQCCHDLLFSNIDIEKQEANYIVSDTFDSNVPIMYGHVPKWSILALVAHLACPKTIVGPSNFSWIRMQPHLLDGISYGGLIGSCRSIAPFLQSILRGSMFDSSEPLFTPLLHSKMTFGLHVRPHRGLRVFHKEGGGAGCHSSIQFRPNDDLAGCIIAGDATFNVNGLLDELLDCVQDAQNEANRVEPITRTVETSDGTQLFTRHYVSEDDSLASPHVLAHKETILLISGGPGVPDYFQELVSLLIRSGIAASSVISFDQRGTGQSRRQPQNDQVTIDCLLQDIDAIRRAYNLNTVHILGHSWGGALARMYAQRFPERCSSIVLLSPMTVSQGSDWSTTEIDVMKYNQAKCGWWKFAKMGIWSLIMYVPFCSDYAARQVFRQVMKNYYYDPATAPDPSNEFLAGVSARTMIQCKTAFIREIKQPIVLDTSKVPSLCVFGDEDIYSQAMIDSFCVSFPGRCEILPQCSHLQWVSQPKRLVGLLKSFSASL